MIVAAALVVTLLGLFVVAFRRPALTRIAWRQAIGRPGQSLVLIGGLMVGSAALTASLIAVDSAQRLATRMELLRWGTTDVTVTAQQPFPIELADNVGADPEVRDSTKAVAPQLALDATLANVSSRRTESLGQIIGYDATADAALGDFELVDGTRVGNVGPSDILLNERAATRLGAERGDTVTVTVGGTGESVSLAVRGIARMRGKAAWGFDSVGFVRLGVAQGIAKAPGGVNLLRVVAPEDPERAVAALGDALNKSGLPFQARAAKLEGLASAKNQTSFLRYALIALSAFTLIAGIALIVNLILMLAEERARQLGMLRALGMRRSDLVVIGAIEGAMYSVVAGGLGSGVGLAIGALLAGILQEAFQRFFLPGGAPLPFLYRPSASAVLVGFAGGTAVALLAITAAWRRAGRLNASAAIRGFTDTFPRRRREPAAQKLLRTAGIAAAVLALASPWRDLRFAGIVAGVAVGLSFLRGKMPERGRISLLAIAVAGWAFAAAATADPAEPREFMQFFVALNVVMVFAFSLFVAANLGALERAATLLGKRSAAARQTLRPVLAYLAGRPLRTGLTVGIFALVLSLVTAAATILASDRPRYEEDASGYEVVATAMGEGEVDLTASPDVAAVQPVRFRVYSGALSLPGLRIPQISLRVYEATPELAALPLAGRDARFPNDRAAWQQVLAGNRAIAAIGNPGQQLSFEATGVRLASAGFLRAGRLLSGTIVGPGVFAGIPGTDGTTYLVRSRPGVTPATLAASLERTWFADGLDASTTRSLVDRGAEDLRAFFAIVEFMTRVALALGVLSLGIIGLRAAFERRRMLGTLRTLGYRRRTVLVALLAEAGIVTTAGAVVGAGGGLLLNRLFFREGFHGVDLGLLGGTLLVTYLAVLLVTAGPAIRAARLSPAEAVRTLD